MNEVEFKAVPIKAVNAADRLLVLKKKAGGDLWRVIDEVVNAWTKSSPSQYQSHLINVGQIRKTRKDERHASSTDKKTGAVLRYTVDVPEKVVNMIRCLYNPDELPMNKKFWREFTRRYPIFRIPERI